MAGALRFLFAGTAKAGTTSIYHYLRQHPEVHIPEKETFFFLRDIYQANRLPYPQQRKKEDLVLGHEAYRALYAPYQDGAVGEVGTGYLYHWQESIPQILNTLGSDTRIIIVLRHPTDRCYSSYMHFAKDLHESLSFSEALRAEDHRRSEGWDFMWYHRSLGFYAEQVKAFMGAFAHVKVMIYEEFVQSPEKYMKDLFAFLEVDPGHPLSLGKTHNPSGMPKSALLQKFITHENIFKSAIRPVFRLFFSAEKRAQIRKTAKSKNLEKGPPIPSDMRKVLDREYGTDIAALERLLGRKIEAWSRS